MHFHGLSPPIVRMALNDERCIRFLGLYLSPKLVADDSREPEMKKAPLSCEALCFIKLSFLTYISYFPVI